MLKKIIPFMAILINSAFAQTVEINGNLKNNTYNDTIYICPFVKSEAEIQKSAIDKSGNFNFKFDIQGTDFYRMWTDENNFVLLVLSPGEKIKFTAEAKNMFSTFETQGSYHTELYYEANKKFDKFSIERDSLKNDFMTKMNLIERKEQVFALNYVEKNYNSITALMYIDKIDKDLYLNVFQKVDSALMIEYPNNKLVNDFHQEVKMMSHLAIGSQIPEITLNNAVGEKISISSLRGKVVLIDFWATWCGPCKAEIPNIQRVYNMFKDKGFEVYSISIDKQKDKWLNEQKNMPWINVHDKDGIVAQNFNVLSIPFTILIDENGKIIGKNLRGNNLATEVNNALNK